MLPEELLASEHRSRIDALIDCVRELGSRGWTPATSGNFSMRIDAGRIAISVSGRDKRQFCIDDLMLVDAEGRALAAGLRPSAETALHCQIYQRHPWTTVVLHTHSPTQTVASRLYASAGGLLLEGYELLKAFAGTHTHEAELWLPVVSNSQCMETLAASLDAQLCANPLPAYLIAGHGLYAWGRDLAEARRHLEAVDFLLDCELRLRSLRR